MFIADSRDGGQDEDIDMSGFTVNGRNYRLPTGPVAVVCVDGCEEDYLDVALEQGRMPCMARILEAIKYMTNVKTFSLPW